MDILKDMIGSVLLTRMSAQPYNRYIGVARKISRHEGVLPLVESLNADHAGLKRLGISHLHVNSLYTVTAEEIIILIRLVSNFVKNANEPVSFHAPTFCTSAKMFMGELRAVFVDYHVDSASDFVVF